jgi:hypothetical protein
MKIKELFESKFSSEHSEFVENYIKIYKRSVTYFDAYIKKYGTSGANTEFTKNINATKDGLVDFVIKTTPGYYQMIEARNKLEEKIKNSGGISY